MKYLSFLFHPRGTRHKGNQQQQKPETKEREKTVSIHSTQPAKTAVMEMTGRGKVVQNAEKAPAFHTTFQHPLENLEKTPGLPHYNTAFNLQPWKY